MAWWNDLADMNQFAAFTRYLGDDRAAIKMVNFAACTLTTMGQDFKGRAPLQCKERDVRIVEISIQFSDQKWFQTNSPLAKAMVDDIGLTQGRDASAFKAKHALAVEREHDLRTILVRELAGTLVKLNKVIERYWSGFLSDTGGTREGAERVSSDRDAAKREAAEALRVLRKHEKEKVDRHAYGNYFLYTNMLDGEPLLLISSDFGKAIDEKYLALARKYMTQQTKQSEGLYRQAGDNLVEFEQHRGSVALGDFRDALKALRSARSAIEVDRGTIDKKKPAKKGHDDQTLRDQLTLLGELRKTHKENLKKFTEGQFWATVEAIDGDPFIAVSKSWTKAVDDLESLKSVKKSGTTAAASGKWLYEDTKEAGFVFEFTDGTLTANAMVDAMKAARVKNTPRPSPKPLDQFKREQEAAKKKKK